MERVNQNTKKSDMETATRLFNSVGATGQSGGTSSLTPSVAPSVENGQSVETVHSYNEFGNSCRICRCNPSDMQIMRCPCQCKGSVGYIHLQCLKRWILHRRDTHCEICNALFDMPKEKLNLKRMITTFMCKRCGGAIVKHMLFSASLVPLAHIVLHQVLLCMDNMNQMTTTESLTVGKILLGSCALLTSSALFFNFFEFVTTRFLLIRNILRQWWMFGNTNDFPVMEIEVDSFDLP